MLLFTNMRNTDQIMFPYQGQKTFFALHQFPHHTFAKVLLV